MLREEFHLQTDRRWAHRAQERDRLLYVGVTQRAATRLKQHAAGRGRGAHFTQIFPASRLLSIDWYGSTSEAYRAEPITADVLDEVTSDDVYVSQPG
ncbi:GIY-YIG nuclease family protein [Halolamina salina]|uniref:GIY-YIG nuclease family protein n=1 Tax=Halolamina salina TaxID=1220023 RepID=A0ABD6B659_9EURY